MSDTIFIKGVSIHARHGYLDYEAEVGQRFGQHRADAGPAFHGLYVPGEAQKVAPVSLLLEQGRDRTDVTALECSFERRDPALRALRRCDDIVCHLVSP